MEAMLWNVGHTLKAKRNGVMVDARLTRVSGHAQGLATLT